MSIITTKSKPQKTSFKDSPSMTEQHHKPECEIKNIMRKASNTGMITHKNMYEGQYGNFLNAPDFMAAQNMIADAKSMFETVPAQIRAQFHNNPEEYLAFIQNPDSKQEMLDLGMDVSHFPDHPSGPIGAPLSDDRVTPNPTPEEPPNAE